MLSKEQKERLNKELVGMFPVVKLRLDGHEITIGRVRQSENKTALAVYVDGVIEWKNSGLTDNEVPAICQKVWRPRQRSIYKPSEVARMYKELGKRRTRKMFPNVEKKMHFFDPTFNTAGSLVRQFARLEGLEVVVIGVEQEA